MLGEADRAFAVVRNNGGDRRVIQHGLDLVGLIDCPDPVGELGGVDGLEPGGGEEFVVGGEEVGLELGDLGGEFLGSGLVLPMVYDRPEVIAPRRI